MEALEAYFLVEKVLEAGVVDSVRGRVFITLFIQELAPLLDSPTDIARAEPAVLGFTGVNPLQDLVYARALDRR